MRDLTWGEQTPGEKNPDATPVNSGACDASGVEIIDNNIYFYSELHRKNIMRFNSKLQEMDRRQRSQSIVLGLEEPLPINIHINSYGGVVYEGLAAIDVILGCTSKTVSIVEGICASAATFMSLAADERVMTQNSVMLIHQLSSCIWGKYSDIEDHKRNMDLLMKIIKNIYKKYTKLPMSQIDRIMKHDLLLTSQQCLDYGIIDRIA